MTKKILVISNTTFSIINFRSYLINRLAAEGHEVTVVASPDAYVEKLNAMKVRYVPWGLHRSSVNPIKELKSFLELFKVIKANKPDLVISFTIKPNTYAALVCFLLSVPIITVVTGLGYAFSNKTMGAWVARSVMLRGLSLSSKVLVQNQADTAFIKSVNKNLDRKTDYIAGSGVDTDYFCRSSAYSQSSFVTFSMIARMLVEKGVLGYIEVARTIKQTYPDVVFNLMGSIDIGNPSACDEGYILQCHKEKIINYIPHTDDVRPQISGSACIVLPTYYKEGIPRVLIETASMACPIIASEVPGCTDIVIDGVNGILCQPKNSQSLLAAVKRFLDMSPQDRHKMGQNGRDIVLSKFTNERVFSKYQSSIEEVLGAR
jgi:glycosyltransferase involved in cell wall biosynthesis